jgi:hypothetical protein
MDVHEFALMKSAAKFGVDIQQAQRECDRGRSSSGGLVEAGESLR